MYRRKSYIGRSNQHHVVFDKNGPLKSDYRRYNIKTTQIGDDYAAMAEAILRRYKS